MRYVTDELVQELPKRGAPWCWVPGRVPDCPHRACRRARKCVRPRHMPGRPYPPWPSCPLVTDQEWALWSEGMLRILTGPKERLDADVKAICAKHLKAARLDSRLALRSAENDSHVGPRALGAPARRH